MTMPWPLHTRLLGDTDIFIKDLAFAADTALSTVVKMFTGGASGTTDANGDILCDFATATTLTGCLLSVCTDSGFENQLATSFPSPVTQYPQPPAGYTIARSPIILLPREFVAGQGKVWCRLQTSVMDGPGSSHVMGSQRAAAGVGINWRGIAWAGTST